MLECAAKLFAPRLNVAQARESSHNTWIKQIKLGGFNQAPLLAFPPRLSSMAQEGIFKNLIVFSHGFGTYPTISCNSGIVNKLAMGRSDGFEKFRKRRDIASKRL